MSRFIVLAVLVVVLAASACSTDDSTPDTQPTVESTVTGAPETTVATTAPPETTATTTSQGDTPEPDPGLVPLEMEDPQAFLAALSAQEQSCLADSNLDVAQIMRAMSSTQGTPDGDAILDCLEGETVLRLFLSEPLMATGELSDETSSCIRESLGEMDLRPMMKSIGAESESMDAQVAGLASVLTFTTCLSDEEWEKAAPVLELGPRDKAGTDCLLDELGGPTGFAQALVRTDESGMPGQFIEATVKCGVGFVEAPESMASDSRSAAIGGDNSAENLGLHPETLHPVAVDDPQAFLSGLSPREQSCLGDKGIGPGELLQMTGRSPGGSPETTADIVNCLQDDTILRLFLTSLVGQVEPFSIESSTCIREGFVPLDLRGLLAPPVDGVTAGNSLALSMVALNVSVVCMNDAEWETYAPRLGMQPKDRDSAVCLFEELDGPTRFVTAMQMASLGETPEDLKNALESCRLGSGPTG